MPNLRAFFARLLQRADPPEFPPSAHAALHITDPRGTTHYIHCAYCREFVPTATYEQHLDTCANAFFARVNRALPDTPLDSRDTREVDIWQDEDDGNGAPY